MHCSKCDSDNRDGRKFCVACGAPLVVTCPKCGATNQPAEGFCGDCGAALLTKNAATQSPAFSWSAPETAITTERTGASAIADGERKTVSALFADIKGSSELIRDLDPEEARAIVDPALQIMVDAVRQYDGYVVQSTGDGIFALFGAPLAHEDHPQRALYAALRMQEALRQFGERLANPEGHRLRPVLLEARVGVNSGEVVMRTVETGGRVEYMPIGYVINLAAHLETVAPAGGIAIGAETRRLIEGYFELRALGLTAIKGVAAPTDVYQVIGPGPLRTHFQFSVRRGLTKFVGRDEELAWLNEAFECARSGRGQVAAIVGEAGTGKSRLVYEFKATIAAGCKLLEAYSVSHSKASPWLPLLELLGGYFGLQGTDDAPTRREKIRTSLAALDPSLVDLLPYLWNLLAIQEQPDPLAQMDGQIKHQRTLDAIKRIILRESLDQPVVLIFEDLHWMDTETQALLDSLVDSIAEARVLVLVNYRPEYRHAWSNRSYYSQLRLQPLGTEQTAEMLSALVGDGVDLEPLQRLVIERTEGNPFFIEELVRALFDDGTLIRNGTVKVTRPLAQLRLPPSVQGVLASRIDRLPGAQKELLQTLAVVGRQSPFNLIRHVVSTVEAAVDRMLLDLQLGEFIYEQRASSDVEYIFKHSLTQEVAYNSLLFQRRKLLHERAGAAIEEIYAGRLDDHLSELARHYERSANIPKAVEYLGRAGQQAMGRSSHAEAVRLFAPALELLKTLPETPERIMQELVLQLGLGPALQCTKGFAAPEAASVYARARELCRQIGETPQLFTVLLGLWSISIIRTQLQTAREQSEQLLSIAQDQPDADILLMAHEAVGQTLFFLGEFVPARAHLECAGSLYDPAMRRSLGARGLYSGDISFIYLAWTQWVLGYPDQAVDCIGQARTVAEELTHRFSLCVALYFSSTLHAFLGKGDAALKFADESVRLATDSGFQQLLAWAICYRGSVLAERGQAREAIAQLREGLACLYASGSELAQTLVLGWQAAAYSRLGRLDEGLATVAEALAASQRTGERCWEGELYRLRGDLLLKRDAQDSESKAEGEAEACFRQAIELAQRQQARSWELRATMSLARLLRDTGRRGEAHSMLAEIYGWFTEGFDTADLKEAKALLDELST